MIMKKKIHLVIIIVLMALLVTACNLLPTPVSLQGRLSSFSDSLSKGTDRSSCYTNFYVGTSGYIAGASGAVFNTSNFPVGTYYFTGINSSNPSAVTATLYGPGGYALGYSVTLNMRQDSSSSYFIYSIYIPTTPTAISF